jgi:molybdopterin-biosynthesis enzyme MoeA-like protein
MLAGIINHLKTGLTIHNAYVHANVGEGEIAAPLEAIQNQHPDVDIGSYPQDKDSTISDYRVIFVVKGTEPDELELTCQQILGACQDGGYEAIKI